MEKKLIVFSALIIFCGCNCLIAGNLNPILAPSSDGTMKTLTEVEPRIAINSKNTPGDSVYEYIIDSPGSYYFTGNVTTAKGGIKINASDVSVDLCGYKLEHTYSGTTTKIGILIPDGNNVEIRNGTVNNFYGGIGNSNFDNLNNRIISVNISDSRMYGIVLYSNSNIIKNCTIHRNGINFYTGHVYGIQTGDNSIVTGNNVCDNGHNSSAYVHCIKTYKGSVISGNVVNNNGFGISNHFSAISADEGSVICGNSCMNNAKDAEGSEARIYGIVVRDGSTIKNNSVYSTGVNAEGYVTGIHALYSCLVSNNTSYLNGDNMFLASGCVDDNNCAP